MAALRVPRGNPARRKRWFDLTRGAHDVDDVARFTRSIQIWLHARCAFAGVIRLHDGEAVLDERIEHGIDRAEVGMLGLAGAIE